MGGNNPIIKIFDIQRMKELSETLAEESIKLVKISSERVEEVHNYTRQGLHRYETFKDNVQDEMTIMVIFIVIMATLIGGLYAISIKQSIDISDIKERLRAVKRHQDRLSKNTLKVSRKIFEVMNSLHPERDFPELPTIDCFVTEV